MLGALGASISESDQEATLNNIRLRPMIKEEFEIYLAQFRDRLLKDGMKACRVTEAEGKSIVEKDLSHIDRDGFETKNNFWFTLLNEDSKNVGSLWLSIKGEGETRIPYLGDLFVDPDFRGQGIGKQALLLLETELKSWGIKNNIAAHIVGDFNEAAIKLFKSSGYFITAIMMEKTISS
jgi:GNAT superfamily N-acetyltransferase